MWTRLPTVGLAEAAPCFRDWQDSADRLTAAKKCIKNCHLRGKKGFYI